MAKAISNEELQLRKRARRRLVGAIALVVIVVVFVPMILDNEPKPVSEDLAINIAPPSPEEEETAASSAEVEPLRFRPVEQDSEESPAKSASGTQNNSAPEEAAPVPSAPATASKPISKPATETSASATEEQFVVQLGAFSNADNASRLAAKVRENRFTAYTEVVSTDGGKRTRVRVGPYPTRADAQQASERLKARKLTYGEPVIVRMTD